MFILNSHDPLDAFMFTLRAKETIRQYPKRLKIFFDSGLDSSLSLKEQSLIFYNKLKESDNNKNNSYILDDQDDYRKF